MAYQPTAKPNLVSASGASQTLVVPATSLINDVTLTANCTVSMPPGKQGARIMLVLRQDGTGSRLVTWPTTGCFWPTGAPTLSTAAGAVDIFEFVCLDGKNWYGSVYGLAETGTLKLTDVTFVAADITGHVPSAAQIGDMLVYVAIGVAGNNWVPTTPSGWTTLPGVITGGFGGNRNTNGSGGAIGGAYKIAQAGDPGTALASTAITNGNVTDSAVLAYRSVAQSTPDTGNDTKGPDLTDQASFATPALTASQAGMLIGFWELTANSTPTLTKPGSSTQRVNIQGIGVGRHSLLVCDEAVAAGAVAGRTATTSVSGAWVSGALILL